MGKSDVFAVFLKCLCPPKGTRSTLVKLTVFGKSDFFRTHCMQLAWCFTHNELVKEGQKRNEVLIAISAGNLFLLLSHDKVSKLIEFIKEVTIPVWALRKHDALFHGQEMNKTSIEARHLWKTYC